MSHIEENLQEVRELIHKAALSAGRQPNDVRLIAVSKTFPSSSIIEAFGYGQKDFAENRVVEGEEKKIEIGEMAITYHLIGHLQSNKVNKAIGTFDMIHSVDSLSLATKINTSCEREGKKMPILLQVNTSGEAQKSGITGGNDELFSIVEGVLSLSCLQLRGLMTIGPLSIDEVETRRAFCQLRGSLEAVNQQFQISLPELSMGMTHDFLWAISEGATMVRVGNGIFGKRPYQVA